MIALIRCAKRCLGKYSGFGGSCANFAEALQKTVGGEVWCVWTNEYYSAEGGPAHCFLKWRNNFWDIDAVPKKRYHLEYWAYPDDPDEIEEMHWTEDDVIFGPSYGTRSYRTIRDDEEIEKFRLILKKCIDKL